MNVHVDELGRHVDEQHDGRMSIEIKRLGRACRGMRENAVANESSVHEKILIAATAEAKSACHESARACAADRAFEIGEVFARFAADDLVDAFARRACGGEIEDDAPVVLESKGERR